MARMTEVGVILIQNFKSLNFTSVDIMFVNMSFNRHNQIDENEGK